MKWRPYSIIIIFLITFVAIGVRLYQIQFVKNGYYYARAKSENSALNPQKTLRGIIYFKDKNGNTVPAATNRDFPVIYAVPKEINDPQEAGQQLSAILSTPADSLIKKLNRPNDLYELLLSKASDSVLEKINSLKLNGIYTDQETLRYYPFNNLASQLTGFVGSNENSNSVSGLYGAEKYFDSSLSNGEPLYLTIDRDIQYRSEQLLKDTVTQNNAIAGTIIIQEPKTGKLLAMASYPDFDPNAYQKSNIGLFLNPSLQSVYEPGSVMKVITMSSALDAGKVKPTDTFYDSGSVTLNGRTIRNWDKKTNGKVTMSQIIEKSINVGSVYVEQKLGHDLFYNYLGRFGFGTKTNVDLPGEVSGNIRTLKTNSRDIHFANASFGQGISVTPIQLISAFSAIANRGILMKPYVNDSEKPQVVGRTISTSAAEQIIAMMISAVDKANIAKIDKYLIAGKTGTAQIPDLKHGGYEDKYIESYVGFAPANDPQFTILIKLDKPDKDLAGLTVVPAFREMAQFLLNYYNILPKE